jgi:uncharacterized OB-fold protein
MGRPDAVWKRSRDEEAVAMRDVKWRGEPLKQKQIDEGEVTTTKWRPNAKYAWACGEAISRFLEELKNGRLIATKCNQCKRILFPPRMFCEECFKDIDDWVHIKDTGTIETFSISYLGTEANRLKEPILVGVVSIDGASEKMGIMHYFGEVEPKKLRIGMKVKAVWNEPGERTGSILDIKYFKPLDEKEAKQ